LVSRVNWRAGINCLAPGQTAERDLSWFDASEVDDMSADGKTILFTEFGEGGGIERWGVYLRETTGEPAVRLGDGMAFALSPDGGMALTMSSGPDPELVLLPAGPGEPVRIRNDGIRNYEAMDWMSDGRQIVFAGSAAGQGVRCYIQDIEGGEPRPITPEGDGPPSLFPIGGGEAQRIPGVEPQDSFVAWSADGRSIFVSPELEVPRTVYRVDLSTGERSFWKVLAPADLVGVIEIWSIQISADEQSYCYSYARNISDLYLVDGLR
jgi:Tol biopolymer transport system component